MCSKNHTFERMSKEGCFKNTRNFLLDIDRQVQTGKYDADGNVRIIHFFKMFGDFGVQAEAFRGTTNPENTHLIFTPGVVIAEEKFIPVPTKDTGTVWLLANTFNNERGISWIQDKPDIMAEKLKRRQKL